MSTDSHTDSPGWIKNKKAIYSVHDNTCTNYEKIKKGPQRITKLRPFIDYYEWNEINFPAEPKYWKMQ